MAEPIMKKLQAQLEKKIAEAKKLGFTVDLTQEGVVRIGGRGREIKKRLGVLGTPDVTMRSGGGVLSQPVYESDAQEASDKAVSASGGAAERLKKEIQGIYSQIQQATLLPSQKEMARNTAQEDEFNALTNAPQAQPPMQAGIQASGIDAPKDIRTGLSNRQTVTQSPQIGEEFKAKQKDRIEGRARVAEAMLDRQSELAADQVKAVAEQQKEAIRQKREIDAQQTKALKRAKLMDDQLDVARRNWEEGRIDPNNYLKSMPTFRRVMMGIGAALQGAAEGLSGGKVRNNAFEILQRAIERDINTQKFNLQNLFRKYQVSSAEARRAMARFDQLSTEKRKMGMQIASYALKKADIEQAGMTRDTKTLELMQKLDDERLKIEVASKEKKTTTKGWRQVIDPYKVAIKKMAAEGLQQKVADLPKMSATQKQLIDEFGQVSHWVALANDTEKMIEEYAREGGNINTLFHRTVHRDPRAHAIIKNVKALMYGVKIIKLKNDSVPSDWEIRDGDFASGAWLEQVAKGWTPRTLLGRLREVKREFKRGALAEYRKLQGLAGKFEGMDGVVSVIKQAYVPLLRPAFKSGGEDVGKQGEKGM